MIIINNHVAARALVSVWGSPREEIIWRRSRRRLYFQKKIAKYPKLSPSLPGCSLCRRVFRREPPMRACLRPWFPHLLVHAALQEVVVLNSRGGGDEDNDEDDDEEEDDKDDDIRVGE